MSSQLIIVDSFLACNFGDTCETVIRASKCKISLKFKHFITNNTFPKIKVFKDLK